MSNCTATMFCEGMSLALKGVPMNFAGKGLSTSFGWVGQAVASQTALMKGEPPQLIGVTYAPRTGDAIVLNFCPWCGARIRFDEEAGENKR